ncbi:hypothetical protein VHEMI00484 [[Torrubiella] hemipterigena]|uniref:LysM domain-containing protein n=1 Tax=[Torrubiella] hemipterigena TaxID=1531966 RepID=A0A0A1T2H4_9HYPO|nr:hypothetical protein VHEMI00484 [[Torrubiella] hemipterigena]
MTGRSGAEAAGSVRPRHRRLVSAEAYQSTTASKNHQESTSIPRPPTDQNGSIGQFFEDSISQSWMSVQGLASSFMGTGEGSSKGSRYSSPAPRDRANPSQHARSMSTNNKASSAWGPQPPNSTLTIADVAAGSMAQRDAALRAAKTASVLESHDGVNGGLDIVGKHKRRNSNDMASNDAPPDEYLVYVHHVQKSDTYAGIILRYKCGEDAFRKANGLWSRDSIQTRKWLTLPVDTCEVRGRPCDAPSWSNAHSVDLLARTPSGAETHNKMAMAAAEDDFFSSKSVTPAERVEEDKRPWTHVRWVKIDSMREPVEVGRIARQSMGYFPPRRKQSLTSASSRRPSIDLLDAVSDTPQRRDSMRSNRPQLSSTPLSNASRSRGNSDVGDARPAWMRRPGGVGTMSRKTRAPGPANDNFNNWASKHFPMLKTDDMPSMSVMDSEVLRFGFSNDSAAIAESSFEQGRTAEPTGRHGTGLDRAAAAVETWLRGALSKRPNTPLLGARRHGSSFGSNPEVDFIELADTASDDGRLADTGTSLLGPIVAGTTGRSDAFGTVTPRISSGKAKKDD